MRQRPADAQSELWRNWSGVEACRPMRVLSPTGVADIQEAVAGAARDGLPARAVGSGHSFNGAAVAPGVQLRMKRMSRLLDVDPATGRVTVEAGMPLHRLNGLLAEHGLALPNLGDVDRQTVSTHVSATSRRSATASIRSAGSPIRTSRGCWVLTARARGTVRHVSDLQCQATLRCADRGRCDRRDWQWS